MTTTAKPPILWFQAGLFASTFAVALIAVPWYGFAVGFPLSAWIAFVVFTLANGISITAGYHRLWAHNAYKAHWSVRLFFALFGAAATQNSVLIWASGHRRHHRHVDDNELDPYSAKRGLWFSHIGWMLRDYKASRDDFSNVRDLQRDPIVAWQHRHYTPLALAMNFLPPLFFGLATGHVAANMLLAGFLRLVLTHHTTFFINSLAHYWGKRPYTDSNTARDNGWIALLTYGEGYHNYHHLFQNDYRNGVRWWQFDPTKWMIRSLSWVGLTRDLKRTPVFKIREALVARQFQRAEQGLAKRPDAEKWKDYLAGEYQQFMDRLHEWKGLQERWYTNKRDRLAEHAHHLQQRWEQTTLRTRYKELEYGLMMQYKRLQHFNLQLGAA